METFVMKILDGVQRIVCGAVYVGGPEPDGQNDVASPAAVFGALLSHSKRRAMKVMHSGPDRAGDDIKILSEFMTGATACGTGSWFIPPFTWVITARLSPKLFEQVRAKKLAGFSMAGTATARTAR